MMIAVFVVSALALALGLTLGFAAYKFKVKGNALVDEIDAILPQTQCGQCGYPGCRPYAEAIANREAKINQCPPGGQEGVDALAELLGVETLPLAEADTEAETEHVVVIDENLCIGCTLCIKACPVDAIVGAPKVMTTIIKSECTGCDLCLPVCPVDCIERVPLPRPVEKLTERMRELSHAG